MNLRPITATKRLGTRSGPTSLRPHSRKLGNPASQGDLESGCSQFTRQELRPCKSNNNINRSLSENHPASRAADSVPERRVSQKLMGKLGLALFPPKMRERELVPGLAASTPEERHRCLSRVRSHQLALSMKTLFRRWGKYTTSEARHLREGKTSRRHNHANHLGVHPSHALGA